MCKACMPSQPPTLMSSGVYNSTQSDMQGKMYRAEPNRRSRAGRKHNPCRGQDRGHTGTGAHLPSRGQSTRSSRSACAPGAPRDTMHAVLRPSPAQPTGAATQVPEVAGNICPNLKPREPGFAIAPRIPTRVKALMLVEPKPAFCLRERKN